MPNAKILFFDLETAGVNALRADLGFVICFGFKWAHEKKAHCLTIDPESLARFNDRKLLQEASKIFIEADLVVAHFGSVFDRRFLQGRLLIQGLPPLPHTKLRDTCFQARKIANFSSNRLKHLCKILGCKNRKLENNWPTAWFQVMAGNQKALKGMATYCKGDVLALEELYNKLKVFDHNHERLVTDRSKCGLCGSGVQYRGFAYLENARYRRYVCKECGHWDRERRAAK